MAGEMQAITKIPRSYKFTLGDRLMNLGLDVLTLLVEARYTHDKIVLLNQANVKLEQMRYLLRLCKDLEIFTIKSYEYIAREINKVGSLIGGWMKQQGRKPNFRFVCFIGGVVYHGFPVLRTQLVPSCATRVYFIRISYSYSPTKIQ